jgi:hypothetical protein
MMLSYYHRFAGRTALGYGREPEQQQREREERQREHERRQREGEDGVSRT